MTWTLARVLTGFGMEGECEIPVFGDQIAPDDDDTINKNTLSMREAANYINALEEAMTRTIGAWVVSREFEPDDNIPRRNLSRRIDEMADILSMDAWVQVTDTDIQRSTQNGTKS